MNGKRLRKLRKEQELTQEQLADKLGVTRSLIGMVETEKQEGGREFLLKVSDFFNVSIDYLLGKTDDKEIKTDEKENLINDFLKFLVDNKIITDSENIDKNTRDLIMTMVKKEIDRIKEEK